MTKQLNELFRREFALLTISLRTKKDLSQLQLSNLTGVHIARIEAADALPAFGTMYKIGSYFNLKPSDLVNMVEQKIKNKL